MKDSNYLLFVILAMSIGISLASQAGVNSQLRTALGSPFQAAFISFLVGTVLLGAIIVYRKESWDGATGLTQIPLWAYAGGLLGAFNISMSLYLAPRLGAVTLAVIIVFGQLSASIFYDKYGILGYPKLDLTISKLIGAMLLFIGAILVAKKG